LRARHSADNFMQPYVATGKESNTRPARLHAS